MKRKGIPWSLDEDAMLRQLWAEGFSASLIAEQFYRRTRNAVIGRAARLNLGPHVTIKCKVVPFARRVRVPLVPPVDPAPCARCGVRRERHAEQGCKHYRKALAA